MRTYNTISSHTDHFEIQKRDSEESLLTFVNLFPSIFLHCFQKTEHGMRIYCLLNKNYEVIATFF